MTFACAGLLLLAACTGDNASEDVFRPTLEWVDCPSDVEILMLTRHRCGFLTVLQDRSQPAGKTIRLFVTEVYPAGDVPPATRVGSGFSDDLGRETGSDGGTGATRVNSIVYSLSLRGLGHSEPSLACPEADALDARAAASPSNERGLMADFLDAVGACRERLVASGVDPADYDVQAIARDMEDLRVALGIGQWYFLNSYGTNARYLFEYLRQFPERVRAAWLDSPQFPQVDEVNGGGIGGTRYALRQLFRACAADPACSGAYPDLEATWAKALARLDRAPLHGFVRDTSTGRIEVTVDAAKLLRAARFTLGGDGPQNLTRLPSMIAAAAEGRLPDDLARIVATDRLFCAGYHPICVPQEGFSLGNYLTVLCRDEVPFLDPAAITAQAAGEPAFEQVFANHPYLAACEVWDVPPGDPVVHEPVTTDVPLLILPGQFDSFSPPSVSRSAAETLEHAWVVEVPGQTHNTLGFHDCPIEIRNAWIQDPMSPPDTTCLKGMPSVPFATGGMG